MALTASALSSDRWPGSRYSDYYGYESRYGNGQVVNQMAQAQNQVTLTLYVLDGGVNGQLLSGVDVTVYDAAGNSIGGVTDSRGSIALNGLPGAWQFTLAKDGYKTSNLKYVITKSQVAATYLQRMAQSTSSQAPAETTTYPQGATSTQATYNQAGETAQMAPTPQPVQSQQPVSLTIDVYETSLNGTALPGVQVTGQDAAGNSLYGVTDSNGAVILSGQPGAWQFSFTKEGYETLNLDYNVTETEEVAAYLQRAAQPVPQSITSIAPAQTSTQAAPQSRGLVDFTVYVHEGDINGTALSGVLVTGQDASGNNFSGVTDSNGAAVLSGQPGTWQFSFTKEGYETLNLSYNVASTDYGDVYLQSASSADQSASAQSKVPVVSEVTPT